MSAVIPFSAQKSSISWVSRMPPMAEPERRRRFISKLKAIDRRGLFRRAHQGHRAVELQQLQIGIQVVVGGDGVENEVEAADMLLHLGFVLGDDDFVGAEADRVGRFIWGRGEQDDVGAEGFGEFHAHVTEAAEADNPDLLSFADIPVAQWANRW